MIDFQNLSVWVDTRRPLLDHQGEALAASDDALTAGRSALVVLPTGSGKTLLLARLTQRWHSRGRKVLIVAPREKLVNQIVETLEDDVYIGPHVEMADQRVRRHSGLLAPRVVVASVQSLNAKRLAKYAPDWFDLIVFDEADFGATPSYLRVSDYFAGAKRFGCTATPARHDGKPLTEMFDDVVYKRTLPEMIEAGVLPRVKRHAVDITAVLQEFGDISDIMTASTDRGGRDFNPVLQNKIFSEEKPLHAIVRPMLERAGERPTIVFGTSIKQAERLADVFNRYRPGCARSVSGEDRDRDETLQAFERGEFQFLTNCALVDRGVDLPSVACVGMARPTLSLPRYLQMVGRGTRPGKEDLLVIDFTFNSDVHPLSMTNALTEDKVAAARADEILAEKGNDGDAQKAVKGAEEELRADPTLREQVRARVLYLMREVGTAADRKHRVLELLASGGGVPKDIRYAVRGYITPTSPTFDEAFTTAFRSYLPAMGQKTAQKKQRILEALASDGKLPPDITNQIVARYIHTSSRMYDDEFAKKYRSFVPSIAESVAEKKRRALASVAAGDTLPRDLNRNVRAYLCQSSPSYDKAFAKKFRRYKASRADVVVNNKSRILAALAAGKGVPEDLKGAYPSYTKPSGISYDKSFAKKYHALKKMPVK